MSPSYSSLNLVLLGPPGSGKSTQASRLASSFHLPHISTRAMLRDEVDRGTSVGVDARKVMERGELVPDRVLAGLMLQRLDRDDCARGRILDLAAFAAEHDDHHLARITELLELMREGSP